MKKILFALSLFFICQNFSFAIDWYQVQTPLNRVAYVDLDSITQFKNYYFYNIKFQNPGNSEFIILTMQSSKFSPLSARIRTYKEDEYKALEGDYKNITSIVKSSLEPVTYESVVNSCYKAVDNTVKTKNSNALILSDDGEDVIEE